MSGLIWESKKFAKSNGIVCEYTDENGVIHIRHFFPTEHNLEFDKHEKVVKKQGQNAIISCVLHPHVGESTEMIRWFRNGRPMERSHFVRHQCFSNNFLLNSLFALFRSLHSLA